MTQIALTCLPKMLCTIGLTIDARPGRRDPEASIQEALAGLGGPVARDRVTLADAADVVLSLQALERALPDFELTVQSVVASALATELLDHSAEPTTTAWSSLRSQMTGLTKLGHGMTDGCAAARHFTPFVEHPVPAAISKQHLPAGDLVVWSVGDGGVVAVDRDPYVIGRVSGVDLRLDAVVISKRHTRFERSNEGWLIRDLQSASGFSVDGRRIMGHLELRLGAVIQFARPYALVVLAVQPAR